MKNTTGNNDVKKSSSKKAFIVVLCAACCIMLICSVTAAYFGISSAAKLGDISTRLSETDETTDSAQEDDIKIGEKYTVRSTLAISDAYKSGDTSKLSDIEKETLDMASTIIDGIIKPDMKDDDKEQAVYDWLINNTKIYEEQLVAVPSGAETYDNPYCMLKYKEGVCVGYATTMRLFMQMLDIDCKVVHSTDLSHTWDLVKLDDEWYHTDVYSDIKGAPYANFNMNDALALRAHTWNQSFFPAATGLQHNYMYEHREKLDSIYDLPQLIKDRLDKKSDAFALVLPEKEAGAAEAVMSAISERFYGNESLEKYNIDNCVMEDGNEKLLFVTITYAGSDDSSANVDADKLTDALDKAFCPATGDGDLSDPPEDGRSIINAAG